MDKKISYIKKEGKILKKQADAVKRVKRIHQQMASRKRKRRRKENNTLMNNASFEEVFVDLEPPSLQVLFPASTCWEDPEDACSPMEHLLDVLKCTPLGEILSGAGAKSWDVEDLLVELIESGGLLKFLEEEDIVNWELVNAMFDVFFASKDQSLVYEMYKSLDLALKCEENVPDAEMFRQYLQRIGYRKDGAVVDLEGNQLDDLEDSGEHWTPQCPLCTWKVQLYLRLLLTATKSKPANFSSSNRVDCMVEVLCMLLHLFLDISGGTFEADLSAVLAALMSSANVQGFRDHIRTIVSGLIKLGPTHRSQVHMLSMNWSHLEEVQALKRLWGVTILREMLPDEVPVNVKDACRNPKECMMAVFGVLNSPDALIESLETTFRDNGGKVASLDWWLVDSIFRVIENLITICNLEDSGVFEEGEKTRIYIAWSKFQDHFLQYARSFPSLFSVGLSSVKNQLRVLQLKWDECIVKTDR